MQKLELQNQRNAELLKSVSQNIRSLEQANKNYFSVDGLKLTYTGADETFKQYMFNKTILSKESTTLKFKIVEMKSNEMSFGVVDYAKEKNNMYSFESRNAMCYSSHGNKLPEGMYEGSGFKVGDMVEITVDCNNRTVNYFVNGVLKASQRN